MAPQAGFEPATDRLTADSSTTELLWNDNLKKLSQVTVPTLPLKQHYNKEVNFISTHLLLHLNKFNLNLTEVKIEQSSKGTNYL